MGNRGGFPISKQHFSAVTQFSSSLEFCGILKNEDAIDSENAIDSLKRFHVEQDCGQSQMLLVMLLWELGKHDLAKQRFAEGAAYIQVHSPGHLKELRVVEAEQMLGLNKQNRMELIEHYFSEMTPSTIRDFSLRAQWRQERELYRLAIEDFTEVIDRDPKMARAWRSRGICHYELRQDDAALADLSKAIELNASDVWSLKTRGWVYRRLGSLDLALADFSQSVQLKPDTPYLWIERAKTHRQLGDFDLAMADCRRAIEITPEQDSPWFKRADAYALLGDILATNVGRYDEACREYAKAIELDPDNADLAERRDAAKRAAAGSGPL
jgi:tetratricopeptide (TPR) repeat protein